MGRQLSPLLLLLVLLIPLILGAVPSHSDDPEAKLPFFFAAYAVTWAAFFAYLFFLSRKQRELRCDFEALRQTLEEQETGQQRTPPAHE